MLAQSFQSADELGISNEELSALIGVLGMLERGEIKPSPTSSPSIPNGFHMSSVSFTGGCNTVACIKGWAQIVGGDHLFDMDVKSRSAALYKGLFMYGDDRRFKINNPAQAATALRSYLTTGSANWHEAVSGG